MAERRSRTERPATAAAPKVTPRLLMALLDLRALGAAATSDLELLMASPSRSRTNQLLRRLLDAGLVNAHVEKLAGENMYVLSPAGWDLVSAHVPEARACGKPPKVEPTPHRLARAMFWSRFAMAVHRSRRTLTAWPEEVLRSRADVVPDLIVVVAGAGDAERTTYMVEIDVGTESSAVVEEVRTVFVKLNDATIYIPDLRVEELV